ncbi:MAG: radical SAM protein [Lentisphaeria bacterium]
MRTSAGLAETLRRARVRRFGSSGFQSGIPELYLVYMQSSSTNNGFEAYEHCELCPRRCRVNRLAGDTGFCGETAECRIGSFNVHHGEEPPISGSMGSGTIFFSGCPCQCFYCQNYQLSLEHTGRIVKRVELLDAARQLVRSGVHNLNFVTPTHYWPHTAYISHKLREEGVEIPFVYNSSGYERAALIPAAAEHMQIFLVDFKYSDPDLAAACSSARDYPEIALAALREMVAHRGFLEPFDPDGAQVARQGVLVRHLVLPGQLENSLNLLKMLRREFGRMLPLSVMSQFRSMPECQRRQLLTRGVTAEEYQKVCEVVEDLGFRQVLLQPSLEDSGYVPDFAEKEPFPAMRGHLDET